MPGNFFPLRGVSLWGVYLISMDFSWFFFFYLSLSRSTLLCGELSKLTWQSKCPPELEASSKMSAEGALYVLTPIRMKQSKGKP